MNEYKRVRERMARVVREHTMHSLGYIGYLEMTSLEHDVLRLFGKCWGIPDIARYLLVKQEVVEDIAENEFLYEEELCQTTKH